MIPLRALVVPALVLSTPAFGGADPAVLVADDFRDGLDRWVVEQRPGGTVATEDGQLVIRDLGGCTVWLRQPLEAPVEITYTAVVSSASRVSDLNCFWMASHPDHPEDLFAAPPRTGAFAEYDVLRTYYVGHGGNTNTTTRFRRYLGGGEKPLLPGHDLGAPGDLLEADRPYHVRLVADGRRAEYHVDGRLVFVHDDPAPLLRGWFGFRTVHSELRISGFRARRLDTPAP